MANPVPAVKLDPEAVSRILSGLSPEQLAEIRARALAAGLSPAGPFQRLADGGIRITITLPPEVSEPLLTWAEAADETPQPFIEKIIIDSTTAFVFQDWGGAEPAKENPVPAGGVPTGTPAAAAAK